MRPRCCTFACGFSMTPFLCHRTTHDTDAVSRRLARRDLPLLAVDIDVDVDVGASGGGPRRQPWCHPAVTGKPRSAKLAGGIPTTMAEIGGTMSGTDWHALERRRAPARYQTWTRRCPTPAYTIAHGILHFHSVPRREFLHGQTHRACTEIQTWPSRAEPSRA